MENPNSLPQSAKTVITTDPEAANPSTLARRKFLKLGASGVATTLTGCVVTQKSSESSQPLEDQASEPGSDQDQGLVQDQPVSEE